MKNLFGCLGVVIFLPILFIGLILFNSWYLQVIYNIGITPIFEQFGAFLPQLGFWVFVLIDCVIGGIRLFFTDNSKSKSETEKKTYSIYNKEEFAEGAAKALSPIISNTLAKLLQLGLLLIVFNICF